MSWHLKSTAASPSPGGPHDQHRGRPGQSPPPQPRSTRCAWGVVFGPAQAASPLAFWWLDPATVYALVLPLIAGVYIGFAVADGRPHVLAVETTVVVRFVVATAVPSRCHLARRRRPGLAHGVKDAWQHRTQFVAGTRWWPPFCFAVDFVAAALIALAIVTAFPVAL